MKGGRGELVGDGLSNKDDSFYSSSTFAKFYKINDTSLTYS